MIRIAAAWAAVLALCCTEAVAGSIEVLVSSPAGAPVGDVAVVLEPASGAMPRHKATVAIEQQDREFVPYVTVIQAGTSVEFPNRDQVKHHVYSFSPAKTFEIKLYAGKPVQPVIFDKPGEVALGCNIHDWMEAYVLVVNSPYFAKTGANGTAVVANLPHGAYRLRLWHPRQKSDSPVRDIEIGAAPIKQDLLLDVLPRPTKAKPANEAGSY